MLRLSRWFAFGLTLFTTLLAGCTSVQLAYNNAPWLLQFQLDRYFDLNDEQEQMLKVELAQLQQWHKSQALPRYAETLRQWSQNLERPTTFTAAAILENQQTLQKAALDFAQQASTALSPVLQTLTPRQKQQLESRFAAANQEYQQDFLSDPVKAAALRRERITTNYERWLGALTPEQEAVLSDWLNANPNDTQRWAQERLARQSSLLALISQAPQYDSRQQAAAALEQYFRALVLGNASPELQAQYGPRQHALAELTAALLNRMTTQQRQHLQAELNRYATDFEALSQAR